MKYLEYIYRPITFTLTKSTTMLKNKIEFINVLHSILNAENDADIDVIMMAFNGIMIGHGVCFKDFEDVYSNCDTFPEYEVERERFSGFGSMWDYFADTTAAALYCNDIDAFAQLCEKTMDFTLLELGVNLQAEAGPY